MAELVNVRTRLHSNLQDARAKMLQEHHSFNMVTIGEAAADASTIGLVMWEKQNVP